MVSSPLFVFFSYIRSYDVNEHANLEGVNQVFLMSCFNYTRAWFRLLTTGNRIAPRDFIPTLSTSVTSGAAPATAAPVTVFTSEKCSNAPPFSPEAAVNRTVKEMTGPIPPFSTSNNSKVDIRNALALLGKVYGNGARFRSPEQMELAVTSLQSISKEVQDHLFIMPTSSGKTAGMLLSAMFEKVRGTGRVTTVVSPLRALNNNLETKLKSVGLSCLVYGNQTGIAYGLDVILVTPERATSTNFISLVEKLDSQCKLGSLWFDEIHAFATAKSFRPEIFEFLQLSAKFRRSPRFLLSATMPPALVDIALSEGRVGPGMTIHRYASDRPGLHLLRFDESSFNLPIWKPDVDDDACPQKLSKLERIALTLVMHCMNGGTSECKLNRMLLFASTTLEVDRMFEAASFLGLCCSRYHSKMKDVDRDESIKLFRELPYSMIMFATSAFGLGMDFPVEMVINVGLPRGLLELTQNAGRAGRNDPYIGYHLLLTEATHTKEMLNVFESEVCGSNCSISDLDRFPVKRFLKRDLDAVLEYSESKTIACLRSFVGEFIDGNPTVPCIAGGALCSLCLSLVSELGGMKDYLEKGPTVLCRILNAFGIGIARASGDTDPKPKPVFASSSTEVSDIGDESSFLSNTSEWSGGREVSTTGTPGASAALLIGVDDTMMNTTPVEARAEIAQKNESVAHHFIASLKSNIGLYSSVCTICHLHGHRSRSKSCQGILDVKRCMTASPLLNKGGCYNCLRGKHSRSQCPYKFDLTKAETTIMRCFRCTLPASAINKRFHGFNDFGKHCPNAKVLYLFIYYS